MGGVDRSLRLRGEDDEVGLATGVGVGGARNADSGGSLGGAIGVTRADHDVVSRGGEALAERETEASRAADDRDPHRDASSTTSARRLAASRSVISVSAITSGTSASAGASARSMTSASTSPG